LDIEKVGSGMIIREEHSKIVLDIKVLDNKEIVIDRIKMQYQNVFLDGNKDSLTITIDNKQVLELSNSRMSNGSVGIQIGGKKYKEQVNTTTNFLIN
jgi:hypothetical protein